MIVSGHGGTAQAPQSPLRLGVIFVAGSLHLGQLAPETGPFGCASGAIFALRTPSAQRFHPYPLSNRFSRSLAVFSEW
jgi:hypothetical protein